MPYHTGLLANSRALFHLVCAQEVLKHERAIRDTMIGEYSLQAEAETKYSGPYDVKELLMITS